MGRLGGREGAVLAKDCEKYTSSLSVQIRQLVLTGFVEKAVRRVSKEKRSWQTSITQGFLLSPAFVPGAVFSGPEILPG